MISGNRSLLQTRIGLAVFVLGVFLTPAASQAQLLPDPSLAPFPLSETFLLESLPGATKTIYLDFDGHDGYEGNYAGYSIDGNYGSFSDSEKTAIQLAWSAVVEDFLPFNVNVTTKDPGSDALMKTGNNDTTWGVRTVVSESVWDYSWAYMDEFSGSQDYEVFAYCGDVGTGSGVFGSDWIWVAESISHEVGHTLGLDHDGEQPGDGEYWEGHGAGNTHYAPIMGWAKTDEPFGVSHWSIGEYKNATNQEDDLNIITNDSAGPANGFGYRDDDHGSDVASATALSPGVQAEGIIERNTDLDYFSFSMSDDGNVRFDINPARFAPNLDILAKIHASDGTVLHESNPTGFLDAEFDVDLPAGDYYLSIDGTGYGDPKTNGYSDYGSLGYYSIDLETTIIPTHAPADFDQDGDIDLVDVDALTAAGNLAVGVPVSETNARFDLNGDNRIDAADLGRWLADAAAAHGHGSAYLPGDANLDADVDLWAFDGSGDAQVLSENLGGISADGHDVGPGEAEALYDPTTGELFFDVGEEVSVVGIGSQVMYPGNIETGSIFGAPAQNDGAILAFFNTSGLPVGEDSVGLVLPIGLAPADMHFSYTPTGGETTTATTILIGAVWSDGDFNGDGDVDVWAFDGSGDAQVLSENLGATIDSAADAAAEAIYNAATGELVFDVGPGIAVIGIGAEAIDHDAIEMGSIFGPPGQNMNDVLAYFNTAGLTVGVDSVGIVLPIGLTQDGMTFSYTPVGGETKYAPVTIIVPEPGTVAMLLALGIVGMFRRRKSARK